MTFEEKCDWALIYFCQILIGIVIGAMILLATGCAAEPPKQIVRTETVQVPVEVRVPIPAQYTADCVVTPQIPGAVWYITMEDGTKQQMQPCFIKGKPALCNGQAAIEHDDYRAALRQCNADKAALRALK